MIKLTKNHTVYEIYNEWAAESVYCLQKPTQKELQDIVSKEWGPVFRGNSGILSIHEFSRKYITVEKERHVYTCE